MSGDDVGAGWYFTTSYQTHFGLPDLSYGDHNIAGNMGSSSASCADATSIWTVCFQLQVRDATACPGGLIACDVSINTYSDGEIGIWTDPGCTADAEITLNNTINCCPVITNPGNQEVCDSYVLPAITGTLLTGSESYYTGSGATGNAYVAGDVITSSVLPMYIYDAFGTCSDEETFNITINTTPTADAPSDVTACDSYTLPTLTVGNYFANTGGVGPIAAGSAISASQTIFVYAETGTTPNCLDENSFTVTINTISADAPSDVTACDGYILPALTVGNYFSNTAGVGAIPAGSIISSSQTIFVYAETGTTPNCSDENSFTVTINTTPTADAPSDVTACDSYTLPALTVGNYFANTGGVGPIAAGSAISASQTIFVYAETGTTPNCSDENSFTVTINTTPTADAPSDVTACDSYTLPALTVGNYFANTGGVGPIAAGSAISASQTIFVYAETGTTPNCSDENSFTVTINTTPTADAPSDVTACDSYTLPALTVGNYFANTGGVGPIAAGSAISASQTIFVYAETGTTPNCSDENSFTVTINTTPTADAPSDVTACDSYTLPALTVGNYFANTGGVGPIAAGSAISASQTIFVYAETGTTPNCSDENSFTVTINTTPTADAPSDVTACDSYTLPALTVGNYFANTGGVGPIAAGSAISASQTIFVYAETGTTPNCSDENSFTVTINTTPTADAPSNVTACDSYTLPALTVGNYFANTGGVGPIAAGSAISASQTIFVYAETGTTPNCSDENSFTVTINTTPTADAPSDVTACDSYTLPALTVGNYFANTGGVGPIAAGSAISASQTIFVYAETGTTPNCLDENSFTVTINTTPTADAPSDVTACDSYTLPALTVGNYFANTGGVGPIAAGSAISASQTIFVYAETGTTPNCSDENSFTVTINTTPTADAPSDVTACDSYTLPALTVGNYFANTGGVGPIAAGSAISASQTIFVYAETGTTPNCSDENSFDITINTTPTAPSAGTDATYCDGDIIADLFAAGSGGTLTWYDDAALTNVIGSGNSLTPNNSIGASVYYVTETLNGCEGAASSVNITINAIPNISSESSNDVTACGVTDGTINISATGGSGSYSFSIDGGLTFSNTSGSFTGLDVNSYQVVIDDGNCQVTGSLLTISGPGIPAAPTAGTDATYCDGDPISDLTANADASGDNNNLTWYDDAGLTNVVQSGGSTYAPSNSVGSNTYYITETVAGCQSPSTQVTIIINPTPLAPALSGANTYCDGDPISDLQASAGGLNSGTFYWFDDAGLTNNVNTGPVYSPPSTIGNQTFYVVDSLNGCAGPDSSISLTINPTPTFGLSSQNPSTCLGSDGQLIISGLDPNTSYDVDLTDDGIATGNVTYNSDINGNILISGLDAGVYTSITVTLNSCSTLDAGVYNLTDPPLPLFTVSFNNPTTCAGNDGELIISGLVSNTSYEIDYTDDGVNIGAQNFTSDINGDIIISGLDAGVYSSIIVTLNNCSTTDPGTYNLADPPLPVFTVSGSNPTICGGNDGEITVSGLNTNTSYDIDYTDDGIATGNVSYTSDNNGEILILGLNAGVYSVITATLNGCSTVDPSSIGLTDPNAPNPSIISTLDPSGCGTFDAEILIGTLDPSTTYSLDYNFNGSPVATTTITTDVSGEFILSGLDEGTYDAFTLTLAGCVGNDAGIYSLNPVVPTILQPIGAATYCEGQTINDLTASANFGGTINWYDDVALTNVVGTGNTFTIGASISGTYTFYVNETLNGCAGPDSTVTVVIVSQPFIATSADTSICNGDSVVIQIDSISGGSQLTWSNGDTTLTSSVNPSVTTNYIVVVDDGLGCSATDSTLVTVNPNDDATFTLSDFCEGDSNSASNIITVGGDFFFTPSVSDGAIMDSSTAEISNGVGGTAYSVMYLTSGVCADSSIQNVTVNIVPQIPNVGTDTAYCEGEIIIDMTAIGNGGAINWYDDSALTNLVGSGNSFSPTVNGVGSYTYYITESNGNCTSEMDSVKIDVNPNPVADFNPTPSSGVIPLDVVFNNNSTGNSISYIWDFGDNNISTDQNPNYIFNAIGTYTTTLTVTDINGCTDATSSDIITSGVSVFVVPNVFTPNGDGVNDQLNVIYENIESFEGYIANRWGEVIFEWTSLDGGWNGRTKSGKESPTGTYYYVIHAIGADGVDYEITGHLRLIR